MAFPATEKLHFVLLPLVAQGHMIPMVDIARILAKRGASVTIFTTPINANRIKHVISRARSQAKLKIQLLELKLPTTEAGLPEGCENFDLLPSPELTTNLFNATTMLQNPLEEAMKQLEMKPSCIISDSFFYWTVDVAKKFRIPRLVFHGQGSFVLLCVHNLIDSKMMECISGDLEKFLIPGLPDRVEMTKTQVSGMVHTGLHQINTLFNKVREAEKLSYGTIVNSFRELEPEYAKRYEEAPRGKKVWWIGPVSLCNEDNLDKAERGNKASIDEHSCLKWLDSCNPSTVIYICMGSLARSSTAQMIELGLALELSNRPFIWCIQRKTHEFETWLTSYGFEERVKERGLVIHGWAPQVLILSHQAVGGFLMHCGWNSTLEGICAGLPMITWPYFGDQFFNECFIVDVLKIGVRVGVEVCVNVGYEEKFGVLLKKEDVLTAIEALMEEGLDGTKRRQRAKDFGAMAKKAMDKGGSSHLNLTMLIQDIIEQIRDPDTTMRSSSLGNHAAEEQSRAIN